MSKVCAQVLDTTIHIEVCGEALVTNNQKNEVCWEGIDTTNQSEALRHASYISNQSEVCGEAIDTTSLSESCGESLALTNESEEYGKAVAINKKSVLAGVTFPFSDFLAHIIEGGEETNTETVGSFETDQRSIEVRSRRSVHPTRYSKKRMRKCLTPPLTNIVEEDSAIISMAVGSYTRKEDLITMTPDSDPSGPGVGLQVSADDHLIKPPLEADSIEHLVSMTKASDVQGLGNDMAVIRVNTEEDREEEDRSNAKEDVYITEACVEMLDITD